MKAMKAAGHAILLAAALALHHGASAAALDALEGDGWFTWRTEAAERTSAWCCYSGTQRTPAQATCDLDSRNAGYGRCGDSHPTAGFVQLYVRIESGETVKLRALSPSCAVKAERPIRDLGTVDTAESLRWLQRQVGTNPVSTDALAAVAMHRGEAAVDALIAVLTDRQLQLAVREEALLWLAHSESDRGLAVVERLITGGKARLY